MIKASDYIARFLYSRGVRTVYELPGGMITHMLNSLYEFKKIRVVSVHHEQAAAFAADATGRITGVPGVAMATSGPGAINLLTGIGSCHFDSSPAVFITGQVNRHELRGERAIRQLGFQESDIVTMAQPITKAAWQVRTPEDLPQMLERAFDLALAGRPGPVLLDVPMDIQNTKLNVPEPSDFWGWMNHLSRLIRNLGRIAGRFSSRRSGPWCWWVQVYVRETLSFRCASS